MTYVYDDFRVTFSPRIEGAETYDVHAVAGSGATATDTFAVPLEHDELERTVLRLARGRATRRAEPAAARDIDADGLDAPGIDAEQFGSALAEALFGRNVGAAYEQASQRAEAGGHGLRLTLSLAAAPALLSVPWEFLYQRPRFLASQRRTPLVRLLDTGALIAPPIVDAEVRVLGVVASPTGLSPLDVAGERARVEAAVTGMVTRGRLSLDWLEPATPRTLRQALRDGSYHVVHFVGHSDFTAAGEGVIYLEDPDDGRAAEVDETLLANLLSDQRQLRLVVLNSCEGARTTLTDPYAGVATTLIRLGVPAVVAMQFEISDDAAKVFAEELYTNLIGRQEAIDAAVAEARKAIYTEIDKIEWATPVLFVRDPDAELFRFGVAPADMPTRAEVTAAPNRWWSRVPKTAVAAAAGALLAGSVAVGFAMTRDGIEGASVTTTTAAPARATGFPDVRVGAEGPLVEVVQLLLRERGFDVEPNGFFDDGTLDAVMALEEQANLPVDGLVGRVTWQQLVAPVRRGDRGDAVLAAELMLEANGEELTPDDRFSLATQDAVVRFQRAHGLPADGIVDVGTWQALLAAAAP